MFSALLAVPRAHAQSQAAIDAREELGFGRIVISFTELPPYKHSLEAGILVLSFDQPVEASLDEVAKDLPDYVGMARRDPDGRAFRFALNRPFVVNLMDAGDELYVDILPPEWRGDPPALPSHVIKALSHAASERERKAREEARQRDAAKFPYELDVRMTHNPTFNRIVFDWNRFTTANLSREGNNIRIAFGAFAEASLAQLKSDAPKFLRAAKLEKAADGGMQIVLTVDEDVDVRGFREGLDYVVDLTGPDVAAQASANRTAEMVGISPEGSGTAVPENAEDRVSIPGERPEPAPVAPETEASAADGPRLELGGDELLPENAATVTGAPSSPQLAALPARDKPAGEESAEPPAQPGKPEMVKSKPETAGSPKTGNNDGGVHALAEDTGGNLRLTFPFSEPLSAAAFRRGKTIWLVFDTTARLDVEAIKDAQGGKLVDVQHVRTASMQYLRLGLSRAWLAHVSTEDGAWMVDIGDMVGGEAYPLVLQRKLREDQRSIIGIKLEKPGRVHWIEDPEVGDRLAIVTAFAPQRSVVKPQDFVEFEALATAHGIAIRPRSDDVAIRLQLDEVIITRRKGLTLSPGNVHQYAAGRKPLARAGRLGFLDTAEWGVSGAGQFSDRVHVLQRAAALASPEEKNAQRFGLARLYFSNGYAMETCGVLERMVEADPQLANDPSFNALRGAALTLAGRTEDARKEFEVHALAHDPDAALWKGLLDVEARNWEQALEHFERGADMVYSYSPELQTRFRLGAARAALRVKRMNRAADELDALPPDSGKPALEAEAQLLRGWYLESIGRTEEALEAYDAVLRSDQRPAVAEAKLRKTAMLVQAGNISDAEAIEALERLQLMWRGDEIEIATMRMLASLYVDQEHYREAFTLAKNGVIAFPEARMTLMMQDDMKQVFRSLYLKPVEGRLEPIEALGLYYDFRELTPVGRQGDEIIRRLADRLIEFDLLDQAASLLDHQVNNRLKGAARSQVAMRLAMVHLMNHKPDLALQALRQTRQAGIPNEMRRSRNLLEARALGELGQADAAVEILNAMEGDDVETLKADALWTAQKWSRAGAQLEKLLGARWQQPEPLKTKDRFNVLRAAIAYSLAGDQFAVDRMHKKYYEKMLETPDAESFIMVTRPVQSQGTSFRELARDIAATDTLDAFMKEFRSRYDQDEKASRSTAAPKPPRAG